MRAKLNKNNVLDMVTGSGNSQYGTLWVSNLLEKKSKRIQKDDAIPEGWQIGRIINFDKHLENLAIKDTNAKKRIAQKEAKDIKITAHKQKAQERIDARLKIEEETIKLYNEYVLGDYKSLRDLHTRLNLDYSIMTISIRFKKYISRYAENSMPRVSIKG